MTTALRQSLPLCNDCLCPGCHLHMFGVAIHSRRPSLSSEEDRRLGALFKILVPE